MKKFEHKLVILKDNIEPKALEAAFVGLGPEGWSCKGTVISGRYTCFVLEREIDPSPEVAPAKPLSSGIHNIGTAPAPK